MRRKGVFGTSVHPRGLQNGIKISFPSFPGVFITLPSSLFLVPDATGHSRVHTSSFILFLSPVLVCLLSVWSFRGKKEEHGSIHR